MQSLSVISVNIWHIIISLCNLLILFILLKKFLYKPVKKVLAQRQEAISTQFDAAAEAQKKADAQKAEYDGKLRNINAEADEIYRSAKENAERRGKEIVNSAEKKAEDLINRADREIELEKKKAESEMKREIVDVSTLLTEKMLGREISADDHRNLIDSFLEEVGESDDGSN